MTVQTASGSPADPGTPTPFSYGEFATRNLGFVTQAQQERLREATLLVCGTGGMGGAALQCLARAGVGGFVIADIDTFEVSNLNRQVFADLGTVGLSKAEATQDALRRINPELRIERLGAEWVERLPDLLAHTDAAVNGTDDIAATLRLYREARRRGRTVIDAYAAPLPSVYVTGPDDPSPEERWRAPTRGRTPAEWSREDLANVFKAELTFVMAHSSARHRVDLALAAEVAAGKRSRMSFAPTVIGAGVLMASEAIDHLLGRPSAAGPRGYFLDLQAGRIERPAKGPVGWARERLAAAAIRRLTAGA